MNTTEYTGRRWIVRDCHANVTMWGSAVLGEARSRLEAEAKA